MPRTDTSSAVTKLLYPEGGPGRHLKARLKAKGDVLVGGIIAEFMKPSVVKQYQQAGFDFVYIEYEHGMFDMPMLAACVQTARDSGLPVIAKTPQLERQEVAKLLEAGVVGIQLPMTESRQQLETLRSYLKFPPNGTRCVAPGYGNSDYSHVPDWSKWMVVQDQETTLVVHIETKLGFKNAEEIISTPGVDMVYLGPGDGSIAMGHPGDYDHPEMLKAMDEVFALCQKYNVPFGTTASGINGAKRWIDKGAKFFEAADEREFIFSGASSMINDYRKVLGIKVEGADRKKTIT